MDRSWEFQAPQYVDFNNLEAGDDNNVDDFFNVDMESGVRISFGSEEIPHDTSDPAPPAEEASNPAANVDEAREASENPPVDSEKPKKPSNMVTSWGAGASTKTMTTSASTKTMTTSGTKAMTSAPAKPPARVSNGANKIPVGDEPHSGRVVKPKAETPTRKILRQAVAQSIEAARNSPRRTGTIPKRLGTNTSEPRLAARSSRALSSDVAKSLNKPSAMRTRTLSKSPGNAYRAASRGRPALPKTPDILKRARNRLGAMGQQKEDDKRIQLAANRKQAEKTTRGPVKPPARPMAVTKPLEFKFATDARVKDGTKAGGEAKKEFASTLRSYTKGSSVGDSSCGMTVPKPFPSMETARKRRHSADPKTPSKFVSMAEKVNRFQKETPQRFRSRPTGPSPVRSRRGRSASPGQRPPGITVPKTPHLTAKHRARPTYALSREEQEQKDLEDAKQNQFKAGAVGEGVPTFKHAQLEKRAPTIPEPFHLTQQHRAPTTCSDPAPAPFKAQPLPAKLLDAVTGLPEKRLIPVVVPESPAFAMKARLASRKQAAVEPEPAPEPVIRAKPAPHRNIPVILPTIAKKSTVPQPFSFSGRDQTLTQKKEDKIKKVLEEEAAAREFHAQPILAPPPLPPRKPVEVTQPKPFALKIDERVDSRVAKWQEDVTKELEEQRKAASNFKAQDCKVLTKAPFETKIIEKPLRELDNISRPFAHSEKRAEERAKYDMEMKNKEAELEGAKRLLEERRKREEEEEIMRKRREAVPKAQPIRHYKPVEVHPSDKPLTQPMAPAFRLKDKPKE